MKPPSEVFNPLLFEFQIGEHQHKSVIWISFPYRLEVKLHLKTHTKARWSPADKKWFVPDVPHYRNLFQLEQKYYGKSAFTDIHPINLPALERFTEQLLLKGYSPNTIRTYTTEFSQLLKTIRHHPVDALTAEKLRSYFLYCIKKLKLSENLVHSRMNAVKFYFEKVLHREKIFLDIPRPKKPSSLPKAISAYDIKKMFAMMENPKHRLLLKLCYGMGLRVSEIVQLKMEDIDTQRMQVLITRAKGKKDRYINFPESILKEYQSYCREYNPKEYLFEGRYGGQYSVRSVQIVFKNAMKKANINKDVGVYLAKKSFSELLIEQGVNVEFLQEMLRHKSIETTLKYLRHPKRKIKSPLDNL